MSFEPLQLNTPKLLSAFWPKVEKHLKRVADEAVKGEWTMDDLEQLVAAQKIHVFVVTNDPTGVLDSCEVPLVVAVEPIYYPRLPTLHIVALGGRGVKKYFQMFWQEFSGWAYMSGFRAIDGWVDPRMVRLTSALGLKPVYTVMRYDLKRPADELH